MVTANDVLKALERGHPWVREGVAKSLIAGVPWETILTWCFWYGPQIYRLADCLIETWRDETLAAGRDRGGLLGPAAGVSSGKPDLCVEVE